MQREATLHQSLLEALVVLEQGITALSSAFNALYFATFRFSSPGRRFGATVLFLVNLAFLAQSLYLGLIPHFVNQDPGSLSLEPAARLLAGGFAFLASLLITLVLLRQLITRRRS